MLDLSIVIVSFNTRDLTLACIESIKKNTKNIDYEMIVVDNSTVESEKLKLKSQKYNSKIKIIQNETNLGFTRGNNQGIEVAGGRYVLLLNSDTFMDSNVLGEMVEWMDANPKAGVATCALKNKDGSLQGTGGYFPILPRVIAWMTFLDDVPFFNKFVRPYHPMHGKSFVKDDGFYREPRELDWVTGAFLLTLREIAQELHGLDEDYFMYGEDVDFCFRAKKAGWEIWFLPEFSIVHYGGASSKTKEFPLLSEYKGVKIFYRKHYPLWQYPILRVFLKFGAVLRIVVLGILEGGESAKIYAKAFIQG